MLNRGDDTDHAFAGVALNEHRENDPPMVKAQKAVRLLERTQGDYGRVASSFKVTVATIKAWEKLITASAKIRHAVDAGTLTPTAAVKLAELPKEAQDAELATLTANGAKPTVQEVQRRTREVKTGVAATPRFSRRVLTQVVELAPTHELSEDFVLGVKFALGELDPKRVKNLTTALRGIGAIE
jgi:hypothetical protein